MTVDVYSTSLHVVEWLDRVESMNSNVSEAGGVIGQAFERKSRDVIYLPKPVDVDVAHGMSITPLFFLFGVVVGGFVFMTGRMENESEDDALMGPYAVENNGLVGSSSAVLWNSMFVGVIWVSHLIFVLIAVTPASTERVVLCWAVLAVPLGVICQPRSGTMGWRRYGYGAGYDGDEEQQRPAIPACGVPPGLGGLVTFCIGAWVICAWIQYDPDGYRVQLVSMVVGVDLLVVALGHLWDSPPVIYTVVNARVFYLCCVVTAMVILYSVKVGGNGFVTEYEGGVSS